MRQIRKLKMSHKNYGFLGGFSGKLVGFGSPNGSEMGGRACGREWGVRKWFKNFLVGFVGFGWSNANHSLVFEGTRHCRDEASDIGYHPVIS